MNQPAAPKRAARRRVGRSHERRQCLESRRLVGRSHERSECLAKADVAQLAERVLGKDEVTSSILVIGSNLRSQFQAKVVRRSPKGGGGRDITGRERRRLTGERRRTNTTQKNGVDSTQRT